MGKGHEFQDDSALKPLSRKMVQNVPRNIPESALSRYLGAGFSTPGAQDDLGDLEQYQELMMRAMRRQSNFRHLINVAYGVDAELILPATIRSYFFIQNLHATAVLYVGFGVQSGPGKGTRIDAVSGYYEPFQVPQNDIWIAGSAAGVCNIIYAND